MLIVSGRLVDRLMREPGVNGLVRGKDMRTMVPDSEADHALELLDCAFIAAAPNKWWVADFTYVRSWAGFVYVTFDIDGFSRAFLGRHAAATTTAPLVTTALRIALWRRDRAGHGDGDGLGHRGGGGSRFTSVSFVETLAMKGISASIGSVGDAYDSALAESAICLFKNEAIRDGSPF